LLKNLLEHTWKEHCDYNNIEQALQQITTTAIYVNDKHREADNIQKMLNIQSSLYGKKLVVCWALRLLFASYTADLSLFGSAFHAEFGGSSASLYERGLSDGN